MDEPTPTPESFMQYFRDNEIVNLSEEDRLEIFMGILPGSSDITAKLLNDLISDYSVEYLQVIDFSGRKI